jgi:hypothetical protein
MGKAAVIVFGCRILTMRLPSARWQAQGAIPGEYDDA